MAIYRQLHVKIWDDRRFEQLSPNEKLLFIYTWGNGHRNEAALYSLTIKRISAETGLTEEQIKVGLETLSKHNMIRYDWDTSEIWVVNALKYQNISPQGIKAIIKDLQQTESQTLKQAFIEKYNDILSKEVDENNLTITQIIAIRDNFICQYCGKTITEYSDITVDHVIPQSQGGKETYENLVLSCRTCNSAKGNKTAVEFGYPDVKGRPFHISKIPSLLKDPILMKHFRSVFTPNRIFDKQNETFTESNGVFAKINEAFEKSNGVSGTGKGNGKGKGNDKKSTLSTPPKGEEEPDSKTKREYTKREYTPEFEEFWAAYPRKIGKLGAFKCWNTRLREKVSPGDLIQAARNYAEAMRLKGTELDYIKHPSTFLSGRARPYEEWIDWKPTEAEKVKQREVSQPRLVVVDREEYLRKIAKAQEEYELAKKAALARMEAEDHGTG